jgi:hypothetical protein
MSACPGGWVGVRKGSFLLPCAIEKPAFQAIATIQHRKVRRKVVSNLFNTGREGLQGKV